MPANARVETSTGSHAMKPLTAAFLALVVVVAAIYGWLSYNASIVDAEKLQKRAAMERLAAIDDGSEAPPIESSLENLRAIDDGTESEVNVEARLNVLQQISDE